jgi:hypothetical protein
VEIFVVGSGGGGMVRPTVAGVGKRSWRLHPDPEDRAKYNHWRGQW